MIKKGDTCIGGRPKGAKISDFGGILRFNILFCQSVVLLASHQHRTKQGRRCSYST